MIFDNLEKKFNKWSIHKIDPTKVYIKGVFDFQQSYKIKTVEKMCV